MVLLWLAERWTYFWFFLLNRILKWRRRSRRWYGWSRTGFLEFRPQVPYEHVRKIRADIRDFFQPTKRDTCKKLCGVDISDNGHHHIDEDRENGTLQGHCQREDDERREEYETPVRLLSWGSEVSLYHAELFGCWRFWELLREREREREREKRERERKRIKMYIIFITFCFVYIMLCFYMYIQLSCYSIPLAIAPDIAPLCPSTHHYPYPWFARDILFITFASSSSLS